MNHKVFNFRKITLAGTILGAVFFVGCDATGDKNAKGERATGIYADTLNDSISTELNPEDAREDSIAGSINGPTSGNNTGRVKPEKK